MAASPTISERDAQAGLAAGVGAYILWGFLPLLFHLLSAAGSVTVVADRTIWSLLLVGGIVVFGRRMGEVRAALSDWPTLRSMMISAVLLCANWLIYVWAVETGQVLEGSFGYFINPLVNVAIGIGRIPFIALSLALSFGFYGFFRKTAKVASTSGLFVETLMLLPLAIGYIAYTFVRDGGPGVHGDPYYLSLLILTGPATAAPLLLFAFAIQRLRLTTIGMLQYIGPTIQFLLAVFAFHEGLNGLQLLSFGLIWLSLAIYTADSLLRRRAAA